MPTQPSQGVPEWRRPIRGWMLTCLPGCPILGGLLGALIGYAVYDPPPANSELLCFGCDFGHDYPTLTGASLGALIGLFVGLLALLIVLIIRGDPAEP